jgi:hypothetical protein
VASAIGCANDLGCGVSAQAAVNPIIASASATHARSRGASRGLRGFSVKVIAVIGHIVCNRA